MPREHFDQELVHLEEALLQLASDVEAAIGRAISALKDQDVDAARRVIADDDLIDRQQYAIEEEALLLIARQAPLATDLRLISAVIAIASELERMGDYAEGIARITIRGASPQLLEPHSAVPEMAAKAQKMLREAVQAFVNRDVDGALRLGREDIEVDQLASQVRTELLRTMLHTPNDIERALDLVFVAHDLERIAERATNIGERLIFVVTGDVVTLND